MSEMIRFLIKNVGVPMISKAIDNRFAPKSDLEVLDQRIKRINEAIKRQEENDNTNNNDLDNDENNNMNNNVNINDNPLNQGGETALDLRERMKDLYANFDPSTSCVLCTRAHLATVSASLKEAIRFARSNGIEDENVSARLNTAEEEINVLERFDLSPEQVENSPPEDKQLIQEFQPKIRRLRQNIVMIDNVDSLEKTAAEAGRLATEFRKGAQNRFKR